MTTSLKEKQEDMQRYLHEIRQFPLLSPEEELALAKSCAAGDENAIRQMVNSNLRLVVSVAKEYAGRGVPLLDLCQEGSIGLLTAAKKYDYTKNTRFSTYATKWIRQGIGRCIAAHGALIRVPEYTADQIRKLAKTREELEKTLGEEPGEETLAAAMEIPVEKVRKLLSFVPEICSWELLGDGEDAFAPQPEFLFVRQELERILGEMLCKLNDRQRLVLRLHFGMEDGVCHSLEDIGKALSVSKERARQLKNQAMEKLQEMGADFGLEEFLYDME